MNFKDEHHAEEKGRQSFIKGLTELEGDVSILRTKLRKLVIDFRKSEENASVELSSYLNRGVEIHRQVLCSLHKAASNGLLEPLNNLSILCPKQSGSLQSLTISQNNLTSTLTILAPFVNLDQTIAQLKQEMTNDDKLPIVINQLLKLSDYKNKLLLKARDSNKSALMSIFKPLDDFEVYSSSYLWKMIENSIEITKKDPKTLSKISKILEKIDAKPEEKIKASLARGIDKRLEWLLGTDKLNELGENTHVAVSELSFMLEKVIPNFSEKMNLNEFIIKTYRDKIESAIEPHLTNLAKLRESPGLLVLIFQWISEYGDAIKKLCPNALQEIEIQMLYAKVKELMPDFISHMEGLLSEWINRALKSHISNEKILELAETKDQLTDSFPEQMFSAINQQLSFISNRLSGEVLIEVFRVCSNRLLLEQNKEMKQMNIILNNPDPEMQLPLFCLSINNNQRASKHSIELQKFCQNKFEEVFQKERIENLFSTVQKGFLNLCNEGANFMALSVIKSLSQGTIALLFTEQWTTSRIVSTAFATMDDYDSDIVKWLASEFYARKFRKRFFEIFVQAYLERIVIVFKILNPCNYEPKLLPSIMEMTDVTMNKKDLSTLLTKSFRELVYRDKFEFIEFSNKFQINFNSDEFFQSLLKLGEAEENEFFDKVIQPFIPNSKELIFSLQLVLTGKSNKNYKK